MHGAATPVEQEDDAHGASDVEHAVAHVEEKGVGEHARQVPVGGRRHEHKENERQRPGAAEQGLRLPPVVRELGAGHDEAHVEEAVEADHHVEDVRGADGIHLVGEGQGTKLHDRDDGHEVVQGPHGNPPGPLAPLQVRGDEGDEGQEGHLQDSQQADHEPWDGTLVGHEQEDGVDGHHDEPLQEEHPELRGGAVGHGEEGPVDDAETR
mmetsp:Transcript_130745/g.406560  ORF Transcript_130745/g.406560 Transcript_130745/m.406560 type:complete len:209 (-) Transcript_130745:741-1367(-)